MPYNATTVNLGDISTGQLVDWIYEAKDSTCDDSIWGDSGLSNASETTTGGMRWWNDDIDRVVYEWADVFNPNNNNAASKNPGIWGPLCPSINEFRIPNIDIEGKQDDRNDDNIKMSEDDLMELLKM